MAVFFAASLVIPPQCDIDVLAHNRMAIRGATRVEFTLRSGDSPGAVQGTVAFSEAALWDHLLSGGIETASDGSQIVSVN